MRVRPDTALLVRRMRELLAADAAWLALAEDGAGLEVIADDGAVDQRLAESASELFGLFVRERPGTGPASVRDSHVFENGLPRNLYDALCENDMRSALCAPLYDGDELRGAAFVANAGPTAFTVRDSALLTALVVESGLLGDPADLEAADLDDRESALMLHDALMSLSLGGAGLDLICLELARALEHDLVLVSLDAVPAGRYGCDGRTISTDLGPAVDLPAPVGIASIEAGGDTLAFLLVDGPGPLPVSGHQMLRRAATVIAVELVRDRSLLEVEWRLRSELLDDLLRSTGPSRPADLVMRCRKFGVGIDDERRVLVAQPEPAGSAVALLEGLRRMLRHAGERDCLATVQCDRVIVAIPESAQGQVQKVVRSLQTKGARTGTPFRCGISNSCTDLARGLREAEGALAFCQGTEQPMELGDYEDLGPLRFVLHTTDRGELVGLVSELLGPLAAHDVERNSELLFTLKVFLATGCHHASTCRDCHIHPSTLKYRLSKIGPILDRPLKDATVRFELRLAFELLDLLERVDAAPFSARRPNSVADKLAGASG